MDTAEKKHYLNKYRASLHLIKALEEELDELRAAQILPAPKADGMPRSKGGTGDLSGYAARCDELLTDIVKEKEKAVAVRRDIEGKIDAMENELYRALLRYRYILSYRWEQIADTMYYSVQSIYRLHGEALKAFEP